MFVDHAEEVKRHYFAYLQCTKSVVMSKYNDEKTTYKLLHMAKTNG